MSARRNILLGVGAIALGAAAFSAQHAVAQGPTLEDEVIVVSSSGEAEVEESRGALDPHVLPGPHQRWAMGAAVGGLLAGLVGLIGFNGVMNLVARTGRVVARASVAAAKAPVKAARVVGLAAARTLKGPGQWLLAVSAVGLFLVGGIALLDVQWKAGLAVGAATAVAGVVGYGRAKGAIVAPLARAGGKVRDVATSPFGTAKAAPTP